jgi:hypothetical protein
MPSADYKVFTSAAPWVVGREALLEYAIDDFLRTMTRQKPWLRARYEALLGCLNAFIDDELERPVPLTALTRKCADIWVKSLSVEQRPLAESALSDFGDYLVKWGWLQAHPLRQPQAA